MAKRICPHCGKNNTAKIFWGMPMMTPELESELEEKKVVLGGCCIPIPCPSHHCFDCDMDIFYDTSEERVATVYFEFQVGGFFDGYPTVTVENNDGNFTATYIPGHATEEEGIKKQISFEEYYDFINRIYNCYILEWNEEYNDPDVLDGTQWHVVIKQSDGTEMKCYGSNAYPPMWKKFIKAVNTLDLPKIK